MPPYGPPAAPEAGDAPADAAVIGVRVPPGAELRFDESVTRQTGPYREFVSPTLAPGKDYTYEVRARWTEEGRVVERSRSLTVRAGDRLMVNFLQGR